MNQKVEKGAEPYIMSPLSLGPLHPGQKLPTLDFGITNGASQIVFTDKKGNPLVRTPLTVDGPPACATKPPNPDKPDEIPFPPCNVSLTFHHNTSSFAFSGKIADKIEADYSTYTFYIRAYNQAGWGNICEVHVEIAPAAPTGAPILPDYIGLGDTAHPGEKIVSKEYTITNGADKIFFVDSILGEPVTGCAMKQESNALHPPCHLEVKLTSSTSFHFIGIIADKIQPGAYSFYIRASNARGESYVCPVGITILSR